MASSLQMPQHIAVIMDGNRRWAKNKRLPISLGHEAGAKNAKQFVKDCFEIGIEYLTLFVFSSENWKRAEKEVKTLNNLLKRYLINDFTELIEKGVRVCVIGDISHFNSEIRVLIHKLQEESSQNQKFVLNLALSYGGRADICFAVRNIASAVANNKISIDNIDEHMVSKNLMTSGIPDPDLFIRTSGESRISNFLIWQLAYTELYFSNKLWPDFTKEDLLNAVSEYGKRERRYGE